MDQGEAIQTGQSVTCPATKVTGAMLTPNAYKAEALPRSSARQRSPRIPPPIVMGPEPPRPERSRNATNSPKVVDRAHPTVKTARKSQPTLIRTVREREDKRTDKDEIGQHEQRPPTVYLRERTKKERTNDAWKPGKSHRQLRSKTSSSKGMDSLAEQEDGHHHVLLEGLRHMKVNAYSRNARRNHGGRHWR